MSAASVLWRGGIAAVALLAFPGAFPTPVLAFEGTVHVLFRSFIKDDGSALAEGTTRTSSGNLVIRAPTILPLQVAYPSLTGTCFSTDERDFDTDPDASARTTVEFILDIDATGMTIKSADGRAMKRTGLTKNVDCTTGKDVQSPRRASTDRFVVGDVKETGGISTLYVSAAAYDPFYNLLPPLRAPDVDFSFVMRVDQDAETLSIIGSTDNFPAFEGYLAIDGNHWLPVLRRDPPAGATALSLIDANLGLNTTNFQYETVLP